VLRANIILEASKAIGQLRLSLRHKLKNNIFRLFARISLKRNRTLSAITTRAPRWQFPITAGCGFGWSSLASAQVTALLIWKHYMYQQLHVSCRKMYRAVTQIQKIQITSNLTQWTISWKVRCSLLSFDKVCLRSNKPGNAEQEVWWRQVDRLSPTPFRGVTSVHICNGPFAFHTSVPRHDGKGHCHANWWSCSN